MEFFDPVVLLKVFVACVFIPIVHLGLIWSNRKKQVAVRAMFFSFFLIGAVILWIVQDESLIFAWTGFSLFGFLALGYMEAFSMICRGFSLTVLCDLFAKGPLSANQLLKEYSNGRGIDWFLSKRINGLIELQLVSREGNKICILGRKARLLAKVTTFYKTVLKLGHGG